MSAEPETEVRPRVGTRPPARVVESALAPRRRLQQPRERGVSRDPRPHGDGREGRSESHTRRDSLVRCDDRPRVPSGGARCTRRLASANVECVSRAAQPADGDRARARRVPGVVDGTLVRQPRQPIECECRACRDGGPDRSARDERRSRCGLRAECAKPDLNERRGQREPPGYERDPARDASPTRHHVDASR